MKHTKEEQVAIWRHRLNIAMEERRNEDQEVWQPNLLSYRGELRPNENVWDNTDPWVSVDLVFAAIRASIPSLLYQNPKFSVTPKKPQLEAGIDKSWDQAYSTQLWLQHVWQETEGNAAVRRAILSAFLDLGVVKVGYRPTFEDDDMRGVFATDEEGNYISGGTDKATGYVLPELEKGDYLRDGDGEIIFDEEMGLPFLHPGTLQGEKFFVQWVPVQNLLFDPEGGNDFQRHRWIAEEWVRPLSEVRSDPRYSPSVRRAVEATDKMGAKPGDQEALKGANKWSGTVMQDSTAIACDMDSQRVRGWTICDFENDRMIEIAKHVESGRNDIPLLDMPMPEGMKHGPYVFLRYNEDPGRFYQKTDVESARKLELENNITRSQMLNHRNQSRPRWFEVRGSGFDSDLEREKFTNGPSNTIVTVKSAEGVLPSKGASMDGNYFTALPDIQNNFDQVFGAAAEQRGASTADTATQASILAAGADLRNSDRRDNLVQKFISDVAKKLLQSAQANADGSIWAKIQAKPEDAQPFFFVELAPSDLTGEFDIDVAIGSTQPKNSQTRVQNLERIVLLFSQNPQIAASPTLVKRVFEAIDINDENLIQEISAVGVQVLAAQGMQAVPEGGGQADQTVAPDQIANQFVNEMNAAGGSPTGGGMN